MSYRIFKAWEASTVVDELGRPINRIGIFTSKVMAETAAKGMGHYGGNGRVVGVHLIEVDYESYKLASPEAVSLDENLISREAEIKRAALAKLTDEEKAALGLK